VSRPGRSARGVCAGFTLLEVILVCFLLLLLVTAGTVLLTPLREKAGFEEGVYRFETLLRMARTDAAGRGLRLQIAPETTEQGHRIRILSESDPLGKPEQFAPYAGCTWADMIPEGLAIVTRSQLVGPAAFRKRAVAQSDPGRSGDAALEAVTFYPDGSSDSAVFELAPADEFDPRRAVIRLDGINNVIQIRMLIEDELEEHYEQIGLAGRSG